MRFTMSTEDKKCTDVPVASLDVIDMQDQNSTATTAKPRKKYYILISITGIIITTMVLTSILIGMHLFTEAQKDILKFSLQLSKDTKEEVTSNPNTNTVQYHIHDADQDTWIVNDYNADITVTKIKTKTHTNCYVTPLNESAPSNLPKLQESKPASDKYSEGVTLVYTTGASPIKDTSFLAKIARDMCSGISVYWLYPRCDPLMQKDSDNATAPSADREKRSYGLPYGAWCSPCFYLESLCEFDAYWYYNCNMHRCFYHCVITYRPCGVVYTRYCPRRRY